MRILHVAPYAPAAWAYGGIPRLTSALVRELGRRGHDVTLCTTDACDAVSRLSAPSAVPVGSAAWPATPFADGVTLRVFPNLSNRLAYHHQLFLPRGLNNYLRQHAGTFDVAHLHACRNAPGAMAAYHLRRAGVPYVLAPNGTAPRIERRLLIKQAYDRLLGQRILAGATRVLAVSMAERRCLEDLGVAPEAIRLVPNPIDLAEFTSPSHRGNFRQRFGLPASPLILFLGKLTPRKRLDVLVRAAATLNRPDWHLVIAGNDMGAEPATRTLLRSLGLEARTHFTGLLQGRDRLDALTDADVVVYPSQDEIFGLVPLEALLCGTPVVVADDSGCGEVIASTGGGQVVRLGDVTGLATAITRVLDQPADWRLAAVSASARVRTAYGQDVVGEQVEGVYNEVITADRHRVTVATAQTRQGVTFVVPVRNGAASIRETLDAILSQADGRPMEVIAVDDRSDDESSELLRSLAGTRPIRIITGPGRGAAAAINAGVMAARFPIICQVDQDVVLQPDWMQLVVAGLDDVTVSAVQGHYIGAPHTSVFARVMARDLEQRYAAIRGRETTHVCTGNSAYRTAAIKQVGLFDETLGYGYDNDMSYRLRKAGYRLLHCRDARSIHRWREGVAGYLTQQYGFGYGRLDIVSKHPNRVTGDSVSPIGMMAHPVLMLIAVFGALLAVALRLVGQPWRPAMMLAAIIVAGLALERLVAGVRAAVQFRDLTPLWFPVVHLARDLAWVAAIVTWSTRRIRGHRRSPTHSMRPRPSGHHTRSGYRGLQPPRRVLGLIPAHNEALTLAAVVAEVRADFPDLELLVIDDGSTDGTVSLLERLDVRWLRFPERMGVGSAMRAGLRYAAHLGFDGAIRIDGDGQHRASDINRLLAPIREGSADVVLGSRYTESPEVRRSGGLTGVRLVQRLLSACISAQTGRRVTDPTSGFCAFGPRAVRLLSEHHPTGYAEPELRLFLNRNGLHVVEVPVIARPRLAGTSSLTAGRVAAAGARVLLAMIIVPLRDTIGGSGRD